MRLLSHSRLTLLTAVLFATLTVRADDAPQGPDTDTAPADLKMSIRATDARSADSLQFEVRIENVDEQDTVLNLGAMLANGKALLPDAIRLTLIDPGGRSRELHFSDRRFPGIAGRVDDYVVPLRAGSAYTLMLRLSDYWCPETKEFEFELRRKPYRVRAELIGKRAQHVNSDTQWLKSTRFWIGKLQSDVVRFQVGERRVTKAAPQQRHSWRRIMYPPLPVPNAVGQTFSVWVGSGLGDDVQRLRFDLLWFGPEPGPSPLLDDSGKPIVRLHMPDDRVVEPISDSGRWIGTGRPEGSTWSRTFTFSWGQNRLEEGWFELQTVGPTFWLELPYGFTRNPADPPAPAVHDQNGPEFIPTLSALAKEDRIVAWDKVQYDLGSIGADADVDRSLKLYHSNFVDPFCEVQLYGVRELHKPACSVEVKHESDQPTVGQRISRYYGTSRLSRIETFNFDRNPGKGRDWGRLHVNVGKGSYEAVVPSSLFRSGHGLANPEHKALIRPARNDVQRARLTGRQAIDIASAAMSDEFPESFKKHQPYRARFTNAVWHVYGTIPGGGPGGTPEALIRDADGVVVTVFHTQ